MKWHVLFLYYLGLSLGDWWILSRILPSDPGSSRFQSVPQPGRWAGTDVQANPDVVWETPEGQWVRLFTAWGMVTLGTSFLMGDDMMQASLCLVSGLFFWLTSVFCLCKDCFGTQKKSLPGKDQILFHFDLLSELFLSIEHNGHASFGT